MTSVICIIATLLLHIS